MRELVADPRKQQQEAHAVKDPKTGHLVVATEEIKRVNLEHCKNVLKHNVQKDEVKELLKLQSDLHDTMMEDDADNESSITKAEFEDVVGKFKRKNKKSFPFLTKSGDLFQNSIHKLCKRMIREEAFPSDFSKTVLYQLWKRKGSKEDLNNHRYIHIKEWLPRLTEALIVSIMKEDIIKSGNKFQIGGIHGHRVEEHLIVVKSIVQRYMTLKSGVVIQLVDIQKFFDTEILRTVMTSLSEAKVNNKAYRYWYKLNERTELSVATPVGLTQSAVVEEIVAQGSEGAALASGADIAQGLEAQFSNSKDEVSHG